MGFFRRLPVSLFGIAHGRKQRFDPPLHADPAPDLMQDGQEEVFSHRAVDLGLTRDPPAMGPADPAVERR